MIVNIVEKITSGAYPGKAASVILQQRWRYGNYCRDDLTENDDLFKKQNQTKPQTNQQKNQ